MGAVFDGIQAALAAVLDLFYQLIPNFGLGIVILTVLVNAALFPLTLKQTRATRAFQAIRPESGRTRKESRDGPRECRPRRRRCRRRPGASPGECRFRWWFRSRTW